ncbi:hypothetical protein Q5752_004082 [Cryptotrichosporon argae]
MPSDAPIPGRFDEDPRVHYDKQAGKYQYEDAGGTEYEWTGTVWIPLYDDDLIKAQQSAYAVAGVDENVPAAPVLAREERLNKRKAGEKDAKVPKGKGKGNAREAAASGPPKKTAVFVSNLPPNTTPELLAAVFSKAGVLHLNDAGEPRIKMYTDEHGRFKGEALVMYFKEGSVALAITLLDDTELELGAGYGNMRVKVAEYEKGKEDESKDKNEGEEKEKQQERKKLSAEDKQRMSKRMRTLESKLAWNSDDEDDPLAPAGGAPAPGASRFNRVVVLKGMFTLQNLADEPELLLELKEDVREEAETLGDVTNVVLYDKEEDGVMTIKFKDATAAQACVLKMHGRFFDGRQISATLYNGRERFAKSGSGAGGSGDGDKEEQDRLDSFAQWLVEGDGEGEAEA